MPQSCLIGRASTVVWLALGSHTGFAQARVVSAPREPSLLNITREWSRASSLGDLRELRVEPGRLELRVWGGFTFATPTQAIVLRRADNRWSAFLARVIRCEIQIPRSVGDTASPTTMRRFTAEARHNCGVPVTGVSPGSQVLATDTVLVAPLDVPEAAIAESWGAAEGAGAFDLPPRVERKSVMDDVFMYVVELRRGNDYRASMIEHVAHPETKTDRQVQDIYTAVNRILRPEQQLKP